ncbi:MAG: glycogen/starch synthase [Pseudomonadota bacterium]
MSKPVIFMVASENGALPGGKAGGVGDVLRELPRALAGTDYQVCVVTPAYGRLHKADGMHERPSLRVGFANAAIDIDVYSMIDTFGVEHVVFHHPLFDPNGDGQIYCDDGSTRPFATDASKFALLSAAAAVWLSEIVKPQDIIHLHDWHAAPVMVLRAFDPQFAKLRQNRTVMTLHNLALQGIRPLAGDPSSFSEWYPGIPTDHEVLIDPRYRDCFNPVSAGIQLADAINTVSPTNAREILEPDDPARAFRGGEGLQTFLRIASEEGRLHGILNGCDYVGEYPRSDWATLRQTIAQTLDAWVISDPINASLHRLARNTLARWTTTPALLITSVGRLTDQKIRLLLHRNSDGQSALSRMTDSPPKDALMILLGSGDREMETDLVMHARDTKNLLFLRGFSEPLSAAMYSAGHWFLMPSSFEPCGISQMMAMRAGQPCVVHSVGGLCDTVIDGQTGLRFSDDSLDGQADAMLDAMSRGIDLYMNDYDRWKTMSHEASKQRFLWQDAARAYATIMYELT